MRLKVPFRRYGGKVYLAKWIVSHFPDHICYIEPFCGSACVLLAKPKSKAEILNDLEGRVMNVFKQIQSHPKELASLLWATPYAQDNWRDAPKNEMEQAVQYIASSQQFYTGNTKTSTFSIDSGHANKNKAHVWADWFNRILPAAARLKDVQLLNQDALKVIERFKNKEGALFYIDPPYRGHENEYEKKIDYSSMVELLHKVKGKVIVSEYPEAQEFFSGWRMVSKPYTTRARTGAHKMKADTKTECLFMNWGNEMGLEK